jgi:hypothetical protein
MLISVISNHFWWFEILAHSTIVCKFLCVLHNVNFCIFVVWMCWAWIPIFIVGKWQFWVWTWCPIQGTFMLHIICGYDNNICINIGMHNTSFLVGKSNIPMGSNIFFDIGTSSTYLASSTYNLVLWVLFDVRHMPIVISNKSQLKLWKRVDQNCMTFATATFSDTKN